MTENREKPQLLLAEDDDDLREAMRFFLGDEFEVITAATPSEAIRCIQMSAVINILVTDFDFRTKLDGLDIAKAFRADFPKAPIILITGNIRSHPGVQKLLTIPLTTIIEKPFELSLVMETIEILSIDARSRE